MRWSEREFKMECLNKYGTLFTVGNGNLGVRGAFEEDYSEQVRGMYVAGLYNKPAGGVSAELVNLPDVMRFKITLDGEVFSMQLGKLAQFELSLDLATGELVRQIEWRSPKNKSYQLEFRRFASKQTKSLIASRVSITPLSGDALITIETGIDGQQTNFGTQQLIERELRVLGETRMYASYETTESQANMTIISTLSEKAVFFAKNRQLTGKVTYQAVKNKMITLQKMTHIFTDAEIDIAAIPAENYDACLAESASKWQEFWQVAGIQIQADDAHDQLLVSFALYHLEIMTPNGEVPLSVGAKGLTGEGYKGHVFWDTEIFILPFVLHKKPSEAKSLLLYRYHRLEKAREKARKNGYKGALFPWESAFSGDEETPLFAAINIQTGKRQKIASALAEHHIVADIAFAVVAYYAATKDDAFMRACGAELLLETAKFWLSRAEKAGAKLVIRDVIGPDEYTEHVDNNAYTNYMAHFNVQEAAKWNPAFKPQAEKFLQGLHLPKPNAEGIIPQDDTFLQKPVISLEKYKKKQGSQSILLDYARSEVNEMQILKQADVVMLLYLFPALFPKNVMAKNLAFYEARTIHDSSLSKAIHAIVAQWCGNRELSYRFFKEACRIDFGDNPHSSDDGIHAASLGAIWLMVIHGFSGIQIRDGVLSVNPDLPDSWHELRFQFCYLGEQLAFALTKSALRIEKQTDVPMQLSVLGKKYVLEQTLTIKF
ncbi:MULTISPECIES: glycoside hydrolase family 65 protein [Listeria]|uniref:glycoside hydrolase family 65 protein n=1 Tax=Listeria TaxID=1637 RepID=UPI000B591FF8|nr:MULTISPECIES: glycoside hydrolase family 65 protein [Listeria]